MRNAPLALVSGAVLLLVAVLAIAGMSAGVVNAQSASTMGIDMDTTGNTSLAIPSIEQCARIDENDVQDGAETGVDTLTVDIIVQGVPAYSDSGTPGDPTDDTGGIIGYQFNIEYESATFTVASSAAVSGPAPDATFIVNRNAGSSVSDFSETVPDDNADNTWLGTGLDIGTGVAESGDGVMHRVTISTEAGAAAGQYVLTLANHAHLDVQGTAFSPTTTTLANIAVNQACGAIVTPTPSPSPSPTPEPTPSPEPTPTPSPSPSPSPSPTPCTTNCPTATAQPTGGTPTRSPSPTPARTASPAALPPTGSTGDGSGPSAPIVLGTASVIAIAMALGGYEITRRMRRQA